MHCVPPAPVGRQSPASAQAHRPHHACLLGTVKAAHMLLVGKYADEREAVFQQETAWRIAAPFRRSVNVTVNISIAPGRFARPLTDEHSSSNICIAQFANLRAGWKLLGSPAVAAPMLCWRRLGPGSVRDKARFCALAPAILQQEPKAHSGVCLVPAQPAARLSVDKASSPRA